MARTVVTTTDSYWVRDNGRPVDLFYGVEESGLVHPLEGSLESEVGDVEPERTLAASRLPMG